MKKMEFIEEELMKNRNKTQNDFINFLTEELISSEVPIKLTEENFTELLSIVDYRIIAGELRLKDSLKKDPDNTFSITENAKKTSFQDVETGIERDIMLGLVIISPEVVSKHEKEIRKMIKKAVNNTVTPNINDMIYQIIRKIESLEKGHSKEKKKTLPKKGLFN